jgi:hypothetical protein
VWFSLLLSVGFQLAAMLFGNRSGLRCDTCPDNRIQVFHDNTTALHLLDDQRLLAAVLTTVTVGLLVRRWARASAPQRRAVAPVLLAGCAMLLALAWTVIDDLLGDPLNAIPATVFFYASALVTIAVLVVFLQRRLARSGVAGLSCCSRSAPLVRDMRQALVAALQELRELTHGIHPALLSERGLAAALEDLCGRAALPTRLSVDAEWRPPDELETTA